MPEDIIRLCVGIEDANDLIEDLSRAVSISRPLCFRACIPCEIINLTPLVSSCKQAP